MANLSPSLPLALGVTMLISSGLAFAADCWAPRRDQAVTGYGDAITSPRHSNLLAKLRKAEAILTADPALESLPDVRLQIKTFIGLPVFGSGQSYATATVGLHRQPVWGAGCSLDQGKADYVVPIELGVNFNDVGPLTQLLSTPSSGHEEGFFPEPEITGHVGRFPVYGRRVLPVTPAGVPLLVPHRVSDHLLHWQKVFDEMLQSAPDDPVLIEQRNALTEHKRGLGQDQLVAQVALGGDELMTGNLWGYSLAGASNAHPMVRINPDIWEKEANEDRVRLIVLHAWINNEEDSLVQQAEAWVESNDVTAWEALIDD